MSQNNHKFIVTKYFIGFATPPRIDGIYDIFDNLEDAIQCRKKYHEHALEPNGNFSCVIFEIIDPNQNSFIEKIYKKCEYCKDIYKYSPITEVFYIPNYLKEIRL